MRKFILTMALYAIVSIANAQFYKSILPSPEFSKALEKIVLDFRLNYNSIKGDSIVKEGGMETYESVVKLPGASTCNLLYYSSRVDTTASFQAIMYKGENYREAVRTYENVYRLVKKSHIRWIDRSSVAFAGEFEPPKEGLRFAVSTLTMTLDDPRYSEFIAEVELLSAGYDTFEVHLNLQAKRFDENK